MEKDSGKWFISHLGGHPSLPPLSPPAVSQWLVSICKPYTSSGLAGQKIMCHGDTGSCVFSPETSFVSELGFKLLFGIAFSPFFIFTWFKLFRFKASSCFMLPLLSQCKEEGVLLSRALSLLKIPYNIVI